MYIREIYLAAVNNRFRSLDYMDRPRYNRKAPRYFEEMKNFSKSRNSESESMMVLKVYSTFFG